MLNGHLSKTRFVLFLLFSYHNVYCDLATSENDTKVRLVIYPEQASIFAVNRSLVLTCIINWVSHGAEDPVSQMRWLRYNGSVSDGYNSTSDSKWIEINRAEDGAEQLMMMKDIVLKEDAGLYKCQAILANSDKTVLEAKKELRIFSEIQWLDCPENQDLMIGSYGQNITCKLTSEPRASILWTKDDQRIGPNDPLFTIMDDGLSVNNIVSDEVAGVVRISAIINEIGHASTRKIRVQVIHPPKINAIISNSTQYSDPRNEIPLVEGGKAELICNASGSPSPKYSWYLSPNACRTCSEPLENMSGYHMNSTTGTLTVFNVSLEIAYLSCKVENQGGQDNLTVAVNVWIRPQIMSFLNKTALAGTVVEWPCNIRGNPTPKTIIQRVKTAVDDDNNMVKTYEKVSDMDLNTSIDQVILYKQVNRSDSGLYSCSVANEIGSEEVLAGLEVEYEPDMSGSTKMVYKTWIGRPVNLTCIANASPKAKFNWSFKDLNDDKFSEHYRLFNDQPGISRLEVNPTNDDVFGTYECHASNRYGSNSRKFELQQLTKPPPPAVEILSIRPTMIKFRISQAGKVEPNENGQKYRVSLGDLTNDDPESRDDQEPAVTNVWIKYWSPEQDEKLLTIDLSEANYHLRNYQLYSLKPKTRYMISFASENAVGIGQYSEAIIRETPEEAVPDKPELVLNEHKQSKLKDLRYISFGSDERIFFKWLPSNDNGLAVDWYKLNWHLLRKNSDLPDDWFKIEGQDQVALVLANKTSLEYSLYNLEPEAFYNLDIRAHNDLGFSNATSIVFLTPICESSITGTFLSLFSCSGYRYNDCDTGEHIRVHEDVEISSIGVYIVLALVILMLIILDLILYYRCNIGVFHCLHHCMCPGPRYTVARVTEDEVNHTKGDNHERELMIVNGQDHK